MRTGRAERKHDVTPWRCPLQHVLIWGILLGFGCDGIIRSDEVHDLAVHQGKIVGVGKFNASATRIIDAEGRAVAPGFIDHHTHYDPQAVWDPLCSSSVQN